MRLASSHFNFQLCYAAVIACSALTACYCTAKMLVQVWTTLYRRAPTLQHLSLY